MSAGALPSGSLDDLSKDDVADVAAALFGMQLLGPQVLLEIAAKHPWLVERAPCRWEMEAILDLARRNKTINEADDEYYALCGKLRKKYAFHRQATLWDAGEPCFPLVVAAATVEIYELDKVIATLGVNRTILRRWELGLSKPHPKLQAQAVELFRTALQAQYDED